jgi:glycine/D-amino acid oxidase-like deaminating enzyme
VLASSSYWWDEAPPDRSEPAAPLPQRVDVLVVGAGYAGLGAALTLARAGRSVLVLDAEWPGFGASTRSGGMIGSGHRVGLGDLRRRYGEATALAVLREGHEALAFTTDLIRREGIACHFAVTGRFRGAWTPAHYEAMARELEEQGRLLGLEAELVPPAEVGREVATERYHGGAVFLRHGAVQPAMLHAGLLARVRELGAVVLGVTPVIALDGTTAVTPRGRVLARDVLIATNGYTPSAAGRLRNALLPVPSFLIATAPLGAERVRRLIPGGRMIVETRSAHCYYRASPDGERLILGGRAALHLVSPARAAARLRQLLVGLFPELRDVAITHAWTGNIAMTRTGHPMLGGADGIWHALGCGGSGIAMMPYLGWRAANKILGTAEGRTWLDGLPVEPYAFHPAQMALRPAASWWWRMRDWREGSG